MIVLLIIAAYLLIALTVVLPVSAYWLGKDDPADKDWGGWLAAIIIFWGVLAVVGLLVVIFGGPGLLITKVARHMHARGASKYVTKPEKIESQPMDPGRIHGY